MSVPKRCVLLFARAPREEERAKGIPRSRRLFAYARAQAQRAVRGLHGVDLLIADSQTQQGSTFGERLTSAFVAASDRGYEQIVVVPTDVPQLTAADIRRAFTLLATHSLVLGPCRDGGVYLIGGGAGTAELFPFIRWQTSSVLDDFRAADPSAALLRALIDVDREADLRSPELRRIVSSLFASYHETTLPLIISRIRGRSHLDRGPPLR